jgi:AcrR family transcriptional regulator
MAAVGTNVKGSIRKRQTELTRKAILEAARELFMRQGYAATTIEQIASKAGVGLSTIYAVFTNKRTILVEVRWQAVQDAGVVERFEAALHERNPSQRLNRGVAELLRHLYATAGDVFAVERAAAGADPEVAESWARHRRERGENFAKVIAPLRPRLAPGLSLHRALDIVQALANYELYEELVVIAGWTPDEYEEWLGRTLRDQLLGRSN